MARIRTVKPSFWSDPKVCHLRRDTRLMLVGLISFADDEGRFVATPTAIAGYVFPHDKLSPKTIQGWLDEAVKSGIVVLYTHDGLEYGMFPNWKKHQKINRAYPSTIPEPVTSFTEFSVNGSRSTHGARMEDA